MIRKDSRSVLKNRDNGDQSIPLIRQCNSKHRVEHKLLNSIALSPKRPQTSDAARRLSLLGYI
ncbi:MAG: hypothetical protein WCO81_13805 [Cyanobacteriota bacterium ELA615]